MTEVAAVAVIVGSLRTGAYSRKVAQALIDRAPSSLACRIVEIGDLPLYNEDLDPEPPAAWTRFRDEVRACQGALFVTPEYNRSVPGGLKNAVDVGSRPPWQGVWTGMPTGVVSCSPGAIGGFAANQALRDAFVFLDMPVMQQPEAYLAKVADLLGERGALKSPEMDQFLRQFMTRFAEWVAKLRRAA